MLYHHIPKADLKMKKVSTVFRIVLAVTALVCIISSMLIEGTRSNTVLAVGLCMLTVANAISWSTDKKGYNPCRKNKSPED